MDNLTRHIDIESLRLSDLSHLEWLVTNGLGGYASGNIIGVPTRRYHSILTPALPSPHGRVVMFNYLTEKVQDYDGSMLSFSPDYQSDNIMEYSVSEYLAEFYLDMGIPVWRYDFNDFIIEKLILMPHQQNTVFLIYRMLSGKHPVRIELRPSMHFRHHEDPVNRQSELIYELKICGDRYEVTSNQEFPSLKFFLHGARPAFTSDGGSTREVFYRMEAERGYESKGTLWNPGYFRAELSTTKPIALAASTEGWETVLAMKPAEVIEAERDRRRRLVSNAAAEHDRFSSELVIAADQFIIAPAGRIEDAARARAFGDEVRTIIAGYHWFTDWGRDTMISLEGLTLCTRRFNEAGWILRTFAYYIKDGLIPNMFPEGKKEGLYHTADATLWFFHAIERYLDYTNDRMTLRQMFPRLIQIIEAHMKGTKFGIRIDPEDGLLTQGEKGYQLTWMDAKVDDWVVTPRRGKAVEINALWYNALSLVEKWAEEEDIEIPSFKISEQLQKVRQSFNEKFWYAAGEYLYDVIDGESGNDLSCRPNQLLAISLKHPVLDESRWEKVLSVVIDKLKTPVGLRSLSPDNPDYKSKYFGDLRARDAAYHQGTVWGWLIGPFIDAWLKIYPEETEKADEFLAGFDKHLNEACIGSISEIFDAEKPFTPRGCIAQAWSVAEVLRCRVKIEQFRAAGSRVSTVKNQV